MFGFVLYDSFFYHLPFHYILFFILAILMSLLIKRTQKIQWDEKVKKIVRENTVVGIVIIIAAVAVRVFLLPRILGGFHVIYLSDALFLIIMGWSFGRARMLSGRIDEEAFNSFLEKQSSTP
jgi:dolichyl-phosphate-mannose--protein O-mannosyl transferase